MLEYGVNVVAGVTPGKGGQTVHDVPVFDTIADTKRHVPVDATMVLVPPGGVRAAAMEAIENRIPLIVTVTEFVPAHDTMMMRKAARKAGVRIIGPNTIGVISPGKSQIGLMPGFIYSEGNIGIVSRSGTLIHEVASNLTYKGIGQSTCVGIGGDAVRGADFVDILTLFRDDDETEKIVLIGEIGGAEEELAAEYIKKTGYPKKIIAYIAGATAPHDKRMGHAGAIVSRGSGTAESKLDNLASAGAVIARSLDDILELIE